MKTKVFNRTRTNLAAAMIAISGMTAVSCTKTETSTPDLSPPGTVTVKATVSGYSGTGQALAGENTVSHLQACIFDGGKMTRIYEDLSTDGNTFGLQVDRRSGTLYLLANTDALIDLRALQESGISETEWLQTGIPYKDGRPASFFTGSIDLGSSSHDVMQVGLKRGVARFDLQVRTAGEASISSITLENAAQSAYLFPSSGGLSPEGVTRNDLTAVFSEPLKTDTQAVLYVYEQANDAIEITVEAIIDGKTVTLTKPLSEGLRRNTIYTVTVKKDSIDVTLEVSFEDWEQGGDTELSPAVRHI